MKCPKCSADSVVVDSRRVEKGTGKRRRRECGEGHRFTTYERPSPHVLGMDRPLRDARELRQFRKALATIKKRYEDGLGDDATMVAVLTELGGLPEPQDGGS